MMQDDAGLVEVIARAICEANSGPWDLMPPLGQRSIMEEANAALAAIEAAGFKVVKPCPGLPGAVLDALSTAPK